jgi:hypothetical protein
VVVTDLTPESRHGVGIVDRRGPQCICDADFPYDRGGWVAFNRHLADEQAAAIARDREGLVEVVARNMPGVLNDPYTLSTHDDSGYRDLARRLLALDAPEAQS